MPLSRATALQWKVTIPPNPAMLRLASRRFDPHLSDMTIDPTELAGKLLIAMPDMSDPRFAKTVIYMCAHSDEGGMGLIINKPAPDLDFDALLSQLEITSAPQMRAPDVQFGGPVEQQRGFVLHSSDYGLEEGTLKVDDDMCMTATLQVIEDIALGRGPAKAVFALGYSGWGPGQLEYEISQNGWLTCDATPELVFDTPNDKKWSGALARLGISPLMLSGSGGRA